MRILGFLLAAAPALFALESTVKVEQGLLKGAPTASGVMVFKGVPYAQPPTGDLRWKAPKKAAAWEGARDAAQFPPTCMQQPYAPGSLYYQKLENLSEDCLYLNIWTAAKSAKERRPVMVWIHGGALTRGSGSTPTYDGEALVKKGVVLVTINYRLGIFGFFAHPALTKESDRNSSGNYGILDQISALEWVQKNIAAFGGDPKRVTIFGESAGSWSVNLLTATPLARGLFHRAIGQSGGRFSSSTSLAEAEKTGIKLAAALGVTGGGDELAALRAKSAEDLLKHNTLAGPAVDGWMLPASVREIFETGKHNDVPLMVGSNADEGTAFVAPEMTQSPEAYKSGIERRYGADAAEVLKLYPGATKDEVRTSMLNAMRDQTFMWQMRKWAELASSKGKSKAYLYYFTRVPPGPGSERFGAFHAAEIAYAFGNLNPPRPWEEADRKLSETMMGYWVNFAATGDPNGKGLPKWPAYQAASDEYVELGDSVSVKKNLNKPALDFLDRYFAKPRAN
jgi:para-nitrobenzyl esterase